MENIDFSLVDWSRAQFALTAYYHWLFVPLTLGITWIIAIMETIYVRTGNPEWKRTTKFWMILFGINFAIGVSTGIIMEFEFGTNWSNYSWFVGDIFGAPLAIEGIMAFFMESVFIAVMFFGWNKVSKRFHLTSTWLVALGSNLSALWILVANGWMQNPVGMFFNPDTARNEMLNFWEVFLNPIAVNKFLHTIFSSYVYAAAFVIGVSSWYLLRKRHILLAKRSSLIASVFGLLGAAATVITGDGSAYQVAQHQPMKLAAMEGLYKGTENAGLVVFCFLKDAENPENQGHKEQIMKIQFPRLLSYLAYRNFNAFVPGIKDLIDGNPEQGIPPVAEKIEKGKRSIHALSTYKREKEAGNISAALEARKIFEENFEYFGYGYFDDDYNHLIPNVPVTFYSFHIMVGLGFLFVLFFLLSLQKVFKNSIGEKRWFLYAGILMIPATFLASQMGWTVAEMGRQPWVIQDIMPTMIAVSQINADAVKLTFTLFALIFSGLAIAEVSIMLKQIKTGPKEEGN
ncbi:MAG: cytochrome ubiquinol oxidase subunit I [Bacteroidales bacterium]|nr:cytochrome ubiquinol oxidase subunit I [Bacteroidales bacterium]MDD3009932.1 cytochrome ubiquinol oxidase subunit I [Bacteroidales bacterium]MDD3960478.1 cytochrome ubiquinol oxidase subunit I [Bacteroidales bacterium]HPE86158.1 cytochrome ubiquinol oxidase subunit I [Bacteroidales bacterium]